MELYNPIPYSEITRVDASTKSFSSAILPAGIYAQIAHLTLRRTAYFLRVEDDKNPNQRGGVKCLKQNH